MRRGPGAGRKLGLKIKLGVADVRERVGAEIAARRPIVSLDQVQRRLELLVTALYGRPMSIAPTKNGEPDPAVHGDTIQLPPELSARSGAAEAMTRYRLFAIEQAERIVRGTLANAPADPLVRDLFLLREAVSIDAAIARSHPGLRGALERERQLALQRRPKIASRNEPERIVESMVRETLASPLDANGGEAGEPADSLAWAERHAADLRQRGVYDGVRPTQVWGAVRPGDARPPDWRREYARPMEKAVARKFSHGRTEADSEASTGRSDKASERYADQKGAPSNEIGGSGDITGAGAGALDAGRPDLEGLPPAIWYDEWDVWAGAYRKRVAGVRLNDSNEGDDSWARAALHDHAALVRKIRHQFERLRARRMLLPRQRSGDEIDVSAVVNAMTDRRMGQGGDDRLYMAARPARRGLAIALLVDASGSTKAPVGDGRSIMDLEKISLLLACEALDALGDRYSAYAFAGKSAENVKLTCIKDFSEESGPAVKRRIGALEPGGFTRLGAAVRHVTTQLAAQTAGHRLLLLLSDGRPNDLDWYQGDFGVEDSRQAILEARASGVYPFCLTIDAEASEYLPRIFGEAGHTILTKAEQLPTALLGVVRGVVRKG